MKRITSMKRKNAIIGFTTTLFLVSLGGFHSLESQPINCKKVCNAYTDCVAIAWKNSKKYKTSSGKAKLRMHRRKTFTDCTNQCQKSSIGKAVKQCYKKTKPRKKTIKSCFSFYQCMLPYFRKK